MQTFKHGTAKVLCLARGGVTYARVSGLVMGATAGVVISSIAGLSSAEEATGQVVVYDAPVLLAPDSLFAVAKSGGGSLPTALVVGPDQIDMFRAYSRLAMQAGILKAVFLTETLAFEWVAQAALVHAYQLSHAAPGQSRPTNSRKANYA